MELGRLVQAATHVASRCYGKLDEPILDDGHREGCVSNEMVTPS